MGNALTPWPRPTLYERLRDAGCEIDNHESDLYVRPTPEAKGIWRDYRDACVAVELLPPMPSRFVSEIDGRIWWEIPFAFDPWWNAKQGDR